MEDEKIALFEDEDTAFDAQEERKIEIGKIFNEYKSIIYTALFYSFGLFIGTYFYKISATEALNALLKPENQSILNSFISDFCVYFSLYLIIVFLGFCLIGYPIINIIPTVIGIVTGIRTAYLFVNYSAKGVGYSLVMIVPYIALFLTVIALTIKISSELSKALVKATKNSIENNELNVKPYVKKYLLLAFGIAVAAFFEALLTNLLFPVVTI